MTMHGRSILTVPAGHPALPGHFPGEPIIPGVLLLDEVLHAIAAGTGAALAGAAIGAVKFLSVARPDEALQIEYQISEGGSGSFAVKAGDRLVATGSCTLTPPDEPSA